MVRVYHGTSASVVESIKREGLRPAHSGYVQYTVTTDRDVAERYAGSLFGKGAVLEFEIPDDIAEHYLHPMWPWDEMRQLKKFLGEWPPFGAELKRPLPIKFLVAVHHKRKIRLRFRRPANVQVHVRPYRRRR